MNSNSVCVDASLAVAWLLDEPYSQNADALRRQWREIPACGPQIAGGLAVEGF